VIARGPLRVPPVLIDVEECMNKEYYIKHEQDIENHRKKVEEERRKIIEKHEKFRVVSTDDEKARIDMRRFLQEKFGSEDVTFVILCDWEYHDGIEAIVHQHGLFNANTSSWHAPGSKIVVIATTNTIAVGERDRIDQELKDEKIAMEQGKWNTLNMKRSELIFQEGNGENPTGKWILHILELYDYNYWKHSDGECIIDLPSFNLAEEYAYAKFRFVDFKRYFKIRVEKDMKSWHW